MNKKTIFSLAIAFSFSLGALSVGNVSAEEGIMPISETEGAPISDGTSVEGEINLEEINDSVSPVVTTDAETETEITTTTSDDESESDSELENDIDYNGTSGEAEVICASTDEPGCEDAAIEPEVDPEMWPLYLSLGALGATIILVFIINLVGRRKK